MPAADRIALRVARETCHLSRIRREVIELAREAGFGSDALAEIEMATDEACSNAMRHARAPDGRRADTISLDAIADGDGLTVTISDGGDPFPFDRSGVDLDEWLATRQEGGLGVYIIRRFMDEVHYRHVPDLGNELRMRKYLAVGGARR